MGAPGVVVETFEDEVSPAASEKNVAKGAAFHRKMNRRLLIALLFCNFSSLADIRHLGGPMNPRFVACWAVDLLSCPYVLAQSSGATAKAAETASQKWLFGFALFFPAFA